VQRRPVIVKRLLSIFFARSAELVTMSYALNENLRGAAVYRSLRHLVSRGGPAES
jgi:hypothetical protein